MTEEEGEQMAVDAVSAPHLEFERIAEVRRAGFSEFTEVFIARQREDAEP